ncbi:C40 family peptidase [Nocardia sp. NBC_00565]|uniref:NlpC/P60 family protein n=1 Tax=Nocardia sp. NBC_00565 TaxID=2975993 RepID=UPI002E8147EF|nr:NlpC/P60 family protein [Nocardia sp. NBC_00565]WUC04401.1 C40 family peptidase [Nocardia sp. NBC_00565]
MTRKPLRRIAFGLLVSTVLTLALAGPASGDSGSASGSGDSGSASGSGGSGSASGSGGSGSASGSSSGSAALPLPSVAGLGALTAAYTQIGKPYEWGGTGPFTWDCSGLVQWAFRQVGVNLPRTTWQQARVGATVPFWALSLGDVVILNDDASHVGIYAGSGQILDAHDWGVPVGLHPLDEFDIFTIRRF